VQTEQPHALGVAPDRIYIDRGFSGTTHTNRAGLDQALATVWDGSVFHRDTSGVARSVRHEDNGHQQSLGSRVSR
jgi:hypothetical protein